MNQFRGFTLIELMIVVAIIAILAAIALPAYQNYVARSQMTAALAEIAGGKTAFDTEYVAEGRTGFSVEELGLSPDTPRCAVSIDAQPEGFIRCQVRGNPLVNGADVTLARDSEGLWACTITGADPRYFPDGCN